MNSDGTEERLRPLEFARQHGTKSGKLVGRLKVVFHRDRVAELRRQGRSWKQIATELAVGITTVRRVFTTRATEEEAAR
jgi:predicted transposase YdaD